MPPSLTDWLPQNHLVWTILGAVKVMDLSRFEERAAFVGHAINAAMSMIAIWIANVVLHVADDRIVPIEEIDRAIRRDIDCGGAEIRIIG